MLDYGCKVAQAFNGWLVSFVSEMVNAGLMPAAIGMLYTPPPTSGIRQGWSISLAVTNTVYVLVVTLAGVLVMTNPTVQASAGIKENLPRLLLGFIGANASWFLCRLMADVGNGVALSMLGDTATPDSVAAAIGRFLKDPVGELVIVVILIAVANFLMIFFFFATLIRVMMWLLLTAVAPLALACHALPQTDGLARMWWRAMSALLVIQVAQALVLRITVTVFLSREDMDFVDVGGTASSFMDVGLLICCIYVLARIPFWAFKRVFNYQASPVVRAAKFAISLLVFRNIGKALASQKAAKAAQTTAQHATRHPPRVQGRLTRAAPPRRPRWTQPELPIKLPASRSKQQPIPGIDRDIDPKAQRRLSERRRWVQPTLPDSPQGQRSKASRGARRRCPASPRRGGVRTRFRT